MNNKIENKRKVPGAYVWHGHILRRITNQKLDQQHVLLDNIHKVRRDSVRLVNVGDVVTFRDQSLTGLPDRCKPGKRKITHMRENGLIGTDKDRNEWDDSGYGWFEKYTP